MSINFWTTENMGQFWSYVKMLLEGISPGILMVVAVVAVSLLLGIIIKAWKESSSDQDKDDDIEIRHY